MDLLRFSTAGSVDDGKSTLIGRLLFDSKGVFEDQLEAVARSTVNRTAGPLDLSLLTDGLRAEREQGITIDVAYRYFATPKRKFIIADTPGHEQYTRNMATGASTAQLAIVLIDARYGALVQSRRHTFLASLLGIPHLVVAVNKMDLVGGSQEVFDRIVADFGPFAARLGYLAPQFIPLSALLGDNVVSRSESMAWYQGPSLLEHLEAVDVGASENLDAFRFPVQLVIRPNLDFRGFAGQIASGVVRVGDEVVALPAGTRSRVREIHTHDGSLPVAAAPQSVTLLLEDEIDISRGDMLVHPAQGPWQRRSFDAHLVWMDGTPLDVTRPYLLKHTTRTVRVQVEAIHARVDVNTLDEAPAGSLQLNEIARVGLRSAQPLPLDGYQDNRRTGSFVLIDPLTHATVAAGMVAAEQTPEREEAGQGRVDRAMREALAGHRAALVWPVAPAGVARTAFAHALAARLYHRGVHAMVLDDAALVGLSAPGAPGGRLDDSAAAAICAAARLLLAAGVVVIADLDASHRSDRAALRRRLGASDFVEVSSGLAATPGWEPAAAAEVTVALGGGGREELDAAVTRVVAWMLDAGMFGAARVVSPGAGI